MSVAHERAQGRARLVSVAGAVATSGDGCGAARGRDGVGDVAGRCAGGRLGRGSASGVAHGGRGSAGRVAHRRRGGASGVAHRRRRARSRVRLYRGCGVRSGLRAGVDHGRAGAGLGASRVALRLGGRGGRAGGGGRVDGSRHLGAVGEGDGVGLGSVVLSDSDDLGGVGVRNDRSVLGDIDTNSDGLGDCYRSRAALLAGNGSVRRRRSNTDGRGLSASGLRRHRSGSVLRNTNRVGRHVVLGDCRGHAGWLRGVDGRGVGDVRSSQVGGVDGRRSRMADRGGAGDPAVGGNGGGLVLSRLAAGRLGGHGGGLVAVASSLARSDGDGAGGQGGDDLSAVSLGDRADSGSGVSGELLGGGGVRRNRRAVASANRRALDWVALGARRGWVRDPRAISSRRAA